MATAIVPYAPLSHPRQGTRGRVVTLKMMKKIMFNDRYGLTQAVLKKRKTMTRRIIPDIWIDFPRSGRQKAVIAGLDSQVLMMDLSHVLGENCLYSADSKYQPKYYKGEVVAVAQRYRDVIRIANSDESVWQFLVEKGLMQSGGAIDIRLCTCAGYDNKMFVAAGLMPHCIRITDIKAERLQDISEEDCMKEGVEEYTALAGSFWSGKIYKAFTVNGDEGMVRKTPREAFSGLIDRISGKGTWERNPWCFAYEFELVS